MSELIKIYILDGVIENYFLSIFLQTVIATLLILITGDFIPKTLFKQNANLALTLFAIPLYLFYQIFFPISKIISGLSYVILKLFGITTDKEVHNKAFGKVDLDNFIQLNIDKADNPEEIETEVKIFQNVLDFSSIKIRDCIVPRPEVVAVDIDTELEELKARFIESGISKIIVYQDNIDNIVGYIHSSEMFRNAGNWKNNIQQVPIVPETMGANKLMKLFMQQKKTLAVVVDEFGGTTGIVSLEDLVEEIFGEIEDEHDTTSYIAKQTEENEYILSARLEIEKVNEMFNLGIPESDDYLTIGGFILNHYQNFPKLHEIVNIGHFQFKIIRLTTTKIELVKLKLIE
jgi:CBS domain containing-hemolysin-like protein